MKVLLLYKELGHARPMIDAHEELAALGVHLKAVHCRGPVKAAKTRKAAEGVDLVIAHQAVLSDKLFGGPPVVGLDRIDGAQLAGCRKWLAAGKLAGVLKSYTLRPAELNNEYRDRVFTHFIAERLGKASNTRATAGRPPVQLTPEQLATIHGIYGFAAAKPLDPFARANPDKYPNRKHDIHFAGTIKYGETEIDKHRRACAAAVEKLPRHFLKRGRAALPNEYRRNMLQSKTVVSPWGCGEACWRDYEALLCECVLIKPRTEHVGAWPDIFNADVCVWCKPDFSDLHRALGEALNSWWTGREKRKLLREMILATRCKEAVAGQLVPIFKGFV